MRNLRPFAALLTVAAVLCFTAANSSAAISLVVLLGISAVSGIVGLLFNLTTNPITGRRIEA